MFTARLLAIENVLGEAMAKNTNHPFSLLHRIVSFRQMVFLLKIFSAVFVLVFSANTLSANTIYINGDIITMDHRQARAEAMAVEGGVIVAVGKNSDIQKLATGSTNIVDLAGQAVLPGFHDLHVHPLFSGLSHFSCVVSEGSNLKETQQQLKACAEQSQGDGWIVGRQWDVPALGVTPHKSMLDSVVRDRAVMLRDTSGHSAWLNSKALAIVGIDRQPMQVEGGIIERDENGEPTGVIREEAIELVTQHIPKPSEKFVDKALVWALNTMLSNGITSFTEASAGFATAPEDELAAYARLSDQDRINQRVRVCTTWLPKDAVAKAAIQNRNKYHRHNVRTDCVKLHLDGVPTDSHTAAMLKPYKGKVSGRDDEASKQGLVLINQKLLNNTVAEFDELGLSVKYHAVGDAAVRSALQSIQYARERNGNTGVMHDVGHSTFVDPIDIAYGAKIGATFEVSPYLWSPSPINDSISQAIGDNRMERVWPIRELIESGALVVAGSDWSIVPSVNPWGAIESLLTREKPGGSKESFGKGQAITLQQALQLFTVNAARQQGHQDRLGRLAAGMLADFIVVDNNPFKIDKRKIHEIKVMKTIVAGEVVFAR